MQACPYDALYIDPGSDTAAKCNFDASRVELGYKPACEIVCPTQAILSGDLDDPASEISQRIATEEVTVRKPEKATRPKLFYVGVDPDLLRPTMMASQPAHLWAEKQPGEDLYGLERDSAGGQSPEEANEVYDVFHATPWGKRIASYLWAKSIAAGVLLIAVLLLNMGYDHEVLLWSVASPILALLFLAITMLLLILDLKRRGRFLYILIKPNFNSWLVLGSYILVVYGILAAAWLAQGLTKGAIAPLLLWPTALFALASAGYSAFLFEQAKGRDLWQSPLLFWLLLIQALAAGAASLILIAPLIGVSLELFVLLGQFLLVSLLLMLAMIVSEISLARGNEELLRAKTLLTKGALRKQFWIFVVVMGIFVPLALLLWPIVLLWFYLGAALLALVGLWFYENLWIKAGQAVPLS
jgi:formate-dependent nitrite reductase membrane component NrfD